MDCTVKKILKIVAIVTAIAAAAVGIYFAVTKILDCKKKKTDDDLEAYVSCSCCDDEPIVIPEGE